MQICDETPFGFGWIAPEPPMLERSSHALRTEAGVFLVDPVEVPGIDQRIRALGTVAGVIQLLDRHGRDCWRFADRHQVPLHRTPFAGIPDSPFEVIRVIETAIWKEVALWWPQERVLVTADALGTPGYYRAPAEKIAVSPPLRPFPPRRLRDLAPEHVLCGHGRGLHGPDAAAAVREAIDGSLRRAPNWLIGQARQKLGR